MPAHIILAITAVVLFLLCLPIAGTRKFILEVFTWTLRFSLMALLILAGVLWFRPELLPNECANFVNSSPELSRYFPAPFTPLFGLAASCFIAAVSLPCLAMLDVARRLAGRRTRVLCYLADGKATVMSAVLVKETVEPANAPPAQRERVELRPVAAPRRDGRPVATERR